MAATEKNGQASMEEILASIRRIVSEDPAGSTPLIDLNRRPNGRLAAAGQDDAADFDLPSMFRHRKPTLMEGRQPLYGRLTDALRQATPAALQKDEQSGSETPENSANGHANGSGRATTPAAAEAFGRASRPAPAEGLSELAPRRPAPSNAQPHAHPSGQPQSSAAGAREAPVERHADAAPASGAGTGVQGANVSMTTRQGARASMTERREFGGPGQDGQQPERQSPSADNRAGPEIDARNRTPVHSATSPAPSQASSPVGSEPPRVMAPFRDTRMSRMAPPAASQPVAAAPAQQAAPSAEVAKEPLTLQKSLETPVPTDSVEKPVRSAAQINFATIVPLELGLPGRDAPSPAPSQSVGAETAEEVRADRPSASPEVFKHAGQLGETAEPPPLPQPQSSAETAGVIEDTTADLLRPMLRQWLAENMPRMVEKALHIEVAQSVQLNNKKPDQG